MTPVRRICLVAPGHVASTPRLVKAADALVEAGYAVHVVAGRSFAPADPFDAEIFSRVGWTHEQVGLDGLSGLGRTLLRRVARLGSQRLRRLPLRLAARAYHANSLRLGTIAARQPADLFLGHCLAALPAVAYAGRRRQRPYGFDAEDFHGAETLAMVADPAETSVIRALQQKLLPGCRLLTAASPLIAARYAEIYGVHPTVLLNVFPRTEAPAAPIPPAAITTQRPARFYWFSQTVGPGRGLESVVAILGRMKTPAELHLRGFVDSDYARRLQSLASSAGLSRPIQFLPPAPAAEMARLAATADLGLATEESTPLNRDLCLTNKIFSYLLAGIPQLLSATSAQRALAPQLGPAALLCPLERSAETAQRLDAFFAAPEEVARARRTAWDLGQNQFCWDVEKQKLLQAVASIS